jgi:hypothetical protein
MNGPGTETEISKSQRNKLESDYDKARESLFISPNLFPEGPHPL